MRLTYDTAGFIEFINNQFAKNPASGFICLQALKAEMKIIHNNKIQIILPDFVVLRLSLDDLKCEIDPHNKIATVKKTIQNNKATIEEYIQDSIIQGENKWKVIAQKGQEERGYSPSSLVRARDRLTKNQIISCSKAGQGGWKWYIVVSELKKCQKFIVDTLQNKPEGLSEFELNRMCQVAGFFPEIIESSKKYLLKTEKIHSGYNLNLKMRVLFIKQENPENLYRPETP